METIYCLVLALALLPNADQLNPNMTKTEILQALPYSTPFRFIDELLDINENGAVGTFTYRRELDFYRGHFTNFAITPAVILTETMAQIGLACLGIFLEPHNVHRSVAMTHNNVDFLKPVFPDEKVTVYSEKIYFRFNKLNCKVRMVNQAGEIVAKGTIAGMIINRPDE